MFTLNQPLCYSFTVSVNVNKSSGSCNFFYGRYAQICVLNKVKNMNVKVFHLMLRVNETRCLVQH